jgi:hypothetical protein
MPKSLSDHCSLMARSGSLPKPAHRPADCPEGGIYIKGAKESGGITMFGNPAAPVVYEGGDGDDKVVIVGRTGGGGVLVDGGKGNDSLTVQSGPVWLIAEFAPLAFALGIFAIVFGAITIIGWRALSSSDRRRD